MYIGVMILNLGLVTVTMSSVSSFYVMLYLIAVHGFSGVMGLLHGLESRKLGSDTWAFPLIDGIVNILIAVACVIFIGSMSIAVYIFGAGLIYSGIVRIVNAFRRTAIVYVQ